MARVNCYGLMSGDNREVSLGGRARNDSISASVNTDNATHSDCSVHVNASVRGNGLTALERRTSEGDQRQSNFTITLPVQSDEFCRVRLSLNHYNKIDSLKKELDLLFSSANSEYIEYAKAYDGLAADIQQGMTSLFEFVVEKLEPFFENLASRPDLPRIYSINGENLFIETLQAHLFRKLFPVLCAA